MTEQKKPEYFSSTFGVDEDLVRRVIEAGLSTGGDFAEVYLQHQTSNQLSFEDGEVNQASIGAILGAGIRVLKGDQTGYAYTEDIRIESLVRAARTAATIAEASPRAPAIETVNPVLPSLYPDVSCWSTEQALLSLDLVKRAGEKTFAADSAIEKVSVRFMSQDEVVCIANSEGVYVEDVRPLTHMYTSCTATRNGRKETNMYSRSGRDGPGFYTEELLTHIANEAATRTLKMFDAEAPPAGEMPVVLAPATSGILLHEAMGHGFEADFNRKKTSIFSEMLGRSVSSNIVTIVDTALMPGARGAINVDDEGVPGQETVLVESGRLVSYLHDRLSAAHYGVDPTGNGRRQDFRSIPMPRMRVTLMENGPHDPEEIIRSVERGLYAIDFANGEVAIGAGDYSFYVKYGYLIEDGKLTRPVKDANLIGSGPDSLAKITMVGNDKAIDLGTWTCGKSGQGVPVGLGMPTVKVSSITVGGV